jgi:hypothetical protein
VDMQSCHSIVLCLDDQHIEQRRGAAGPNTTYLF